MKNKTIAVEIPRDISVMALAAFASDNGCRLIQKPDGAGFRMKPSSLTNTTSWRCDEPGDKQKGGVNFAMDTKYLLLLVEIYSQYHSISEWAVSYRCLSKGDFFKRLRNGSSCTIKTYNSVIQWFSDNWPADLEWPRGAEEAASQFFKGLIERIETGMTTANDAKELKGYLFNGKTQGSQCHCTGLQPSNVQCIKRRKY